MVVLAQIDSLSSLWAEFAENDPELLEIIQKLYENPVNINQADFNRFSEIPFLSDSQIDSIIALRKTKGGFSTKRQLRSLLGGKLYDQLKNFFTISTKVSYAGYIAHRNYKALAEHSEWVGNLWYDYNKAHYEFSENLSAGIITQKDVGEQSIFDYASGFIEYSKASWRIIAGKYYMKFGEGLTFSNPFGSHKSALAVNPLRPGSNNGYSSLSSSENSGQFGFYFSFNQSNYFDIHLFYANNIRDARFSSFNQKIIAINYTGYHRSETELSGEGEIRETLYGLAFIYSKIPHIKIGGLTAQYHYTPPVEYTVENVGLNDFRRQYYKFSGSSLRQYSLFYKANFKNFNLSGEYSSSDMGAPGLSQTIFFQLNKIKFGVKYWRVNADFQSPSGRIFDDSDPFPKAEEGLYAGISYTPINKLYLNFYRLYKKELWRSYFSIFPGDYAEWLFQGDYQINSLLFTFRFKQNMHNDFVFNSGNGYHEQKINKNEFRIQLQIKPTAKFRMISRWQYVNVDYNKEAGSLIYQDFRYKLSSNFLLNTRITFFRTSSWISRIYEYENDLPGAFANYPLYGQGRKWYFMVRWTPYRFVLFYLKYRYLYFENLQLREISYRENSSLKRELKFQLTVKF